MICPRCGRAIPDDSTFCLGCGSRVAESRATPSVNGGGTLPAAAGRAATGHGTRATAGEALAPGDGRKQAYALSFHAIGDERLRYRVARWVCERAPAHPLGEVQEGLLRGDFFTFLALTPAEADVARQGIHGLGVTPALVSLAPASAADMLRSASGAGSGARSDPPSRRRDWMVVLGMLFALLGFGLVLMKLFGGGAF
jgi:hypothetical protein